MEAPLAEAPFYALTSQLILDDKYDAIELHEFFGALNKHWRLFQKNPLGVVPLSSNPLARQLQVCNSLIPT